MDALGFHWVWLSGPKMEDFAGGQAATSDGRRTELNRAEPSRAELQLQLQKALEGPVDAEIGPWLQLLSVPPSDW